MAILKLKDVGKIYATANAVAVGIRRVNVSFEKGEFVAITGKSGCGKTTLLNVMSGLDSYEEGELYINGEETSHYIESDWEQYRKDYISFIFQDYNIIESFSVLHNVEFALTHIKDHKERRLKALELVEKVGLISVVKQKGSKLSGGQKQRTVIARALAKDSPIILADEPTGNLDSVSAKSIISLLGEIAKDKLVVVVTHNVEELEGYATREIRIFDGEISSDEQKIPEKTIDQEIDNNKESSTIAKEQEITAVENSAESSLEDVCGAEADGLESQINTDEMPQKPSKCKKLASNVSAFAKRKAELNKEAVNLGFRRYLSMPKLTTFVTIMCMVAVIGMSLIISLLTSLNVASEFDSDMFAYEKGRLVVANMDKSVFSIDEKQAIADKYDATYTDRDVLRDMGPCLAFYIQNGKIVRSQQPKVSMDKYTDQKITIGRAPTAENEIMIRVPYSYKHIVQTSGVMNSEISILDYIYDIVGCSFYTDNTIPAQALFGKKSYDIMYERALINSFKTSEWYSSDPGIMISPKLKGNEIIKYDVNGGGSYSSVDDELKYAIGTYKVVRIDDREFYEGNYYDYLIEKNEDFYNSNKSWYRSGTYISKELAETIVNDHDYQFSLMFSKDKLAENCMRELTDSGYNVAMSYAQVISPDSSLSSFLADLLLIFLWISTVLFIGVFLGLCCIRVHNSQKKDIAIFRTMGVEAKVIKQSMYWYNFIALLPCLILSTILMFILFLTPTGLLFAYISIWGYVALWVGLFGVMFLATKIINRRIFRETVRKNLKGGRQK